MKFGVCFRYLGVPVVSGWIVGLVLGAAMLSAQTRQQETLTNSDIVKMVQARVGNDAIIQHINHSLANYSLGTADVIRLTRQNVPEKVINAMIARQDDAPGSSADPGEPVAQHDAPPQDRDKVFGTQENWSVHTTKDVMTDEKQSVLTATVAGVPGGHYNVEVECSDPSNMHVYVWNTDPKVNFRTYQTAQGFTTQFNSFGVERIVGITAPRSCVKVKVRVGDQTDTDNSGMCLESPKYAGLVFVGDQLDRIDDGFTNVADKLVPAMGSFFSYFINLQKSADHAEGLANVNDVLDAKSVRIQVPLGASDVSTFEIHPQQSAFRDYTARCRAPIHVRVPRPPPLNLSCPANPYARTNDNFVYACAENRPARSFKGTPDEFAAALPKLFATGVEVHQLRADSYPDAVRFIDQTVKTCASISPKMASVMVDPQGREDAGVLGQQYKVCSRPALVPDRYANGAVYANHRGLVVKVQPQGKWVDHTGFTVAVSFQNNFTDGGSDTENRAEAYSVIYGTINPVAVPDTPSGALPIPALQAADDHLGWHPKDGMRYGFGLSRSERMFQGTEAQFKAALPGFLARADAGSGLPPHQGYDKEIGIILRAAHTCSKITAEMQQKVNAAPGASSIVQMFGDQYKVCMSNEDLTAAVRPYDKTKERGLYLAIQSVGSSSQMSVSLVLANRLDDTTKQVAVPFEAYGVMQAVLPKDR